MWITFAIAGSFVVAVVAMAYFGLACRPEPMTADAPSKLPGADPGAHCSLCEAPLRRPITSDEVVFEVEHRIDAELRDIARTLHGPEQGPGGPPPPGPRRRS